MVYINPIEILKLQKEEVNSIDTNVIRKAKRKLFAEIDLSDNGLLNYYDQMLTKSDCERAIDELDDSNKFEFYYHLATNFTLNRFLANGNIEFLLHPKQESIYNFPGFINFVSPYFTTKIDKVLLKAFQKKDFDLFKSALKADYFTSSTDLNNTYRSLRNEIDQRIYEIDRTARNIKERKSHFTNDNISSIVNIVAAKLPIDFLNLLPPYFQGQINKIGKSINSLQINIWNEFEATLTSLVLIEYILRLNIESISKPIYKNNYEIVKKRHYEIITQKEHDTLLKKWAKKLLSIESQIEMVKNNTIKSTEAYENLIDLFKPIELNNLPSYADEVRTQIAQSIKNLAIACRNTPKDIKTSISLINYALQINVSSDFEIELYLELAKLLETNNQTTESKNKIESSDYKEVSTPKMKHTNNDHFRKYQVYYFILITTASTLVGGISGYFIEGNYFWEGIVIGAVIGGIIIKIIKRKKTNEM